MSRFYDWKPYVPVAERRANAKSELVKLRKKKGLVAQPVEISGRKIAASFWGKGWCDHMESFHDYANRLPRGRTYVRNGSVCHLDISEGKIQAIVSGSDLYNVVITVAPLVKAKWEAVKYSCAGRIGSLIDLLRGKLASGVMEVVSHRQTGLFPLPGEIKFHCDCPDSAVMCKHVAAVLYGVGNRLDHAPEKLFHLRGVNHEEMIDTSAAAVTAATASGSRRRLASADLDDIFGIDLAQTGAEPKRPSQSTSIPGSATSGASGASAAEPAASKMTGAKPKRASETKTAKGVVEGKGSEKGVVKGTEKKNSQAKVDTQEPKHSPPVAIPETPPFPKRLTGSVILSWRGSLGETQLQFASRLGVSGACISQWEKKLRQTLQVRETALVALKKAWVETHR